MVAIALLHPFPLGPQSFESQADELRDAGHEVVVVDLLSPQHRYPDEPDLAAMAHLVIEQMADEGHHSFAVAGLSMGGYVAMALLRSIPSRIDGLALLDTKATADSDAAARSRLDYATRVESDGMGWVPDAYLDLLLGETTRRKRPKVVKRVRKWIEQADPAQVAWAQRAMAVRPDSLDQLKVFRQPSVVVVGQEDTLTPVGEALAMAEALGGAPLSEVPTAGHLSSVECPNRVSDVLVSWADRISEGRRA
jgi:pimeloyl-ACP methyl ester carboxylesterase